MKIYTLLKGALTGFFFLKTIEVMFTFSFSSPNHSIKA